MNFKLRLLICILLQSLATYLYVLNYEDYNKYHKLGSSIISLIATGLTLYLVIEIMNPESKSRQATKGFLNWTLTSLLFLAYFMSPILIIVFT